MSRDMVEIATIRRKFLGTSSLLLIGKLFTAFFGIFIARSLGPESFGKYSYILSITTILTIPTIAGLPQLLIREISKAEMDKHWPKLKGVLNWSTSYAVLISIVTIFVVYTANYFEWITASTGQLLVIAVILIPIRGLIFKQSATLNGFQHPELAQIPSNIVIPVLMCIVSGILYMYKIEVNAEKIITFQIIVSLVALLVASVLVIKKTPTEVRSVTPKYFIREWHFALIPFTFISVISTLNIEIASVLLGYLGDEKSVGYLKVAMQVGLLLALGIVAINTINAPTIARLYHSGDVVATQELLTKSVKLSTITLVPIGFIAIFFGDKIVEFLFGAEYLPSFPLIIVLTIGQVFNVVMGAVGLVLTMSGNEKKAIRTLIIGLALTVLLLIILIPVYGALGAVIATTCTMFFLNIVMAIDVYKITGLKTWLIFERKKRVVV
jgi:O-antigen/teichoic acid export membrane protein